MVLMMLSLFVPVMAVGARDITKQCAIRMPGTRESRANAFDDRYMTSWERHSNKACDITVTLPDGISQGGLYLCFFKEPVRMLVLSGEQEIYRELGAGFAHRYIPFAGSETLTIQLAGGQEGFALSEMRVFSGSEPPDGVQRWQPSLDRADLLVLVAHPDDELLWFGGAIPYYALERGKLVAVATMTCANGTRRSEMLNALWAAGVRNYPIFGAFRDKTMPGLQKSMELWGGSNRIEEYVVALYRRLKPQVVLTHDEKGEYGHEAHVITSRMAVSALTKAAETSAYPDSAAAYGVWDVPKIYLHLYKGNPLVMDWQQPITSRGGLTALEVCMQAYQAYRSQHARFQVKTGGRYSPTCFGLYRSLVGPDLQKNDFFENIREE